MYITCVCLFSALSRRVGALQISIIIIIKTRKRKEKRERKKEEEKKKKRGSCLFSLLQAHALFSLRGRVPLIHLLEIRSGRLTG